MTPKEARELAKTATRYGYFDNGTDVYAKCPRCGKDVKTDSYVAGSHTPAAKVARLQVVIAVHLSFWCDAEAAA